MFRSGCVIMTTIKATSFECGAIAFVSKQGGGANQNGKKWHVKRNRGELCRVRFLFLFNTLVHFYSGKTLTKHRSLSAGSAGGHRLPSCGALSFLP